MSVQPDSTADRDVVQDSPGRNSRDDVVVTDDEKSSGPTSSTSPEPSSTTDIGEVQQEQPQKADPGTPTSTEEPEISSSTPPPSEGRRRQSDPSNRKAHKFGESQAGKTGAFVEVQRSSSEPAGMDNRKARVLTIFPIIADGDVPTSVTSTSTGQYGSNKQLGKDDNRVISVFSPGGQGKYFHETVTTESVFYEEKSPDGATKTDYRKTEERNSMGGETFGSGDVFAPYGAQDENTRMQQQLKEPNSHHYISRWCSVM